MASIGGDNDVSMKSDDHKDSQITDLITYYDNNNVSANINPIDAKFEAMIYASKIKEETIDACEDKGFNRHQIADAAYDIHKDGGDANEVYRMLNELTKRFKGGSSPNDRRRGPPELIAERYVENILIYV